MLPCTTASTGRSKNRAASPGASVDVTLVTWISSKLQKKGLLRALGACNYWEPFRTFRIQKEPMTHPPGTIPSHKDRSRHVTPRKAPRTVAHHTHHHHDDADELEHAPPGLLEIVWPLIGGLILGFLGPMLHALAAAQQPWVVWLVYPSMVLASRPELGLSDELTRTLPQILLYVQFPLEGIYAMFTLRRHVAFTTVMAQLAFVHLVGAFVFWLMSQPGATHGM